MQQALCRPDQQWSDEEWAQRRKILHESLCTLEMEYARRGKTMEDYGWTFAADLQWKRLGDPDPPRRVIEEASDTGGVDWSKYRSTRAPAGAER